MAGTGLSNLSERFASFVSPDPSGCWLWTGAKVSGYGTFRVGPKMIKAHRMSYELHCEPIQDGMVIDHLCRVPACVNPQHLEPVSQGENIRRGHTGKHQTAKTHCPNGHAYSGDNVLKYKGRRYCVACRRDRGIARYIKGLQVGLPA